MRGRDALADHRLHVLAEGGRLLDTRAGRRAQVQPELAAVHRREEVVAHPGREDQRRAGRTASDTATKTGRRRDDGFEQPLVGVATRLNPSSKAHCSRASGLRLDCECAVASCSCPRSRYFAIVGTSVRDSTYDASIANTTASPSGTNR